MFQFKTFYICATRTGFICDINSFDKPVNSIANQNLAQTLRKLNEIGCLRECLDLGQVKFNYLNEG